MMTVASDGLRSGLQQLQNGKLSPRNSPPSPPEEVVKSATFERESGPEKADKNSSGNSASSPGSARLAFSVDNLLSSVVKSKTKELEEPKDLSITNNSNSEDHELEEEEDEELDVEENSDDEDNPGVKPEGRSLPEGLVIPRAQMAGHPFGLAAGLAAMAAAAASQKNPTSQPPSGALPPGLPPGLFPGLNPGSNPGLTGLPPGFPGLGFPGLGQHPLFKNGKYLFTQLSGAIFNYQKIHG